MSTLSVNNITTLTGSTITVASGKTLDASQGFTPPTGHVLQVVSATKTDTWTYNGSTAFQDVTGLAASITPISTSSKILIQVNINVSSNRRYAATRVLRGSTQVGGGTASGSRPSVSMSTGSNQDEPTQAYVSRNGSTSFLDSPNTTSATTYKVQVGNTESASAIMYVNRGPEDGNYVWAHRGSSTITLTEIQG